MTRILSPCITPRCPRPATYRGRCGPCAQRLDLQRGTPAERGYGADWRRRLRLRILQRDPYCREPGCTAQSTTVDHIISVRMGGTDDEDNLRGVCRYHNAIKAVELEGALGKSNAFGDQRHPAARKKSARHNRTGFSRG